jgi:hypothetical protein
VSSFELFLVHISCSTVSLLQTAASSSTLNYSKLIFKKRKNQIAYLFVNGP